MITGRSENMKYHTIGISEDKRQMHKIWSEDYEADKEVKKEDPESSVRVRFHNPCG
jgi:hypothetical protein